MCIEEAARLRRLQGHPNVVRLIDSMSDPSRACPFLTGALVLEYAEHGDYTKWIAAVHSQHEGRRRWSGEHVEAVAQSDAKDLVAAISHCHAHCIAHLDVKPANCLRARRGNVYRLVLADFGGAWNWEAAPANKPTKFGTWVWRCPEGDAGPEADVWSCGAVLFAMLDGTVPFTDKIGRDETGPLLFQGWSWWEHPLPSSLPPQAADMVRKTLQRRSDRITVPDMLSHPWLRPRSRALGTVALPRRAAE